MKVVEFLLWSNPRYLKSDERERCEATVCQYQGECKMYKEGKCISKPQLFGRLHCPHAKVIREVGYTKRAKNFGKLPQEWREMYSTNIKTEYEKIADCGDYIYLPVEFLIVRGRDQVIEELEKDYFIPKTHWNVETIHKIVKRNPRALLSGFIYSYQEKEVPKFIKQLKEFDRALYNEYINTYPEDKEMFEKISGNYVGRKAYLNSLNDGAIYIDCHKNKWVKEDGYLVCYEYDTWLAIGEQKRICKQQIMGDEIIPVYSNDDVNENTVFTS
jgi:hypothetical protein